MKITKVESLLYEYELSRVVGDANTPQGVRRRADLAVFVKTDEQVQGVTIASPHAQGELKSVAEIIIGEDPRAVRGLWQRMIDSTFKIGNTGSISAAIAAIDCALWDLRAKLNGVPLWRELGATRRRVKAYASGLDIPLSDDELRDFYTRMADHGIRGGKLKVGLDPDADLRRLSIVADALESDARTPSLMLDANEYWSPKQAVRRMSEIEREFDIVWCEEPARRWDAEGLSQVSRSIRAAVATGENLRDPHQFVRLLRHEAVDLIQISQHTSGISGALRVADIAQAFDRPVALMHCPGHFSAHLAAVLPHHLMMEVTNLGRDVVFDHDTEIKDGFIVLGDTPGVGITFDTKVLEKYKVERPDAKARRRFLGRGTRAGVRESF